MKYNTKIKRIYDNNKLILHNLKNNKIINDDTLDKVNAEICKIIYDEYYVNDKYIINDDDKKLLDIISNIVFNYYNYDKDNLSLKTRRDIIIYPQQILSYFLCKYTKILFFTIGKIAGNKDHSTISVRFNKTIPDYIDTDKYKRKEIEDITQSIKQEFEKNGIEFKIQRYPFRERNTNN